MSAWRPITETEPETREDVLLWVPETGHGAGVPMLGYRSSADRGSFVLYHTRQMGEELNLAEVIFPAPTHWMPRPAGPEETAEIDRAIEWLRSSRRKMHYGDSSAMGRSRSLCGKAKSVSRLTREVSRVSCLSCLSMIVGGGK